MSDRTLVCRGIIWKGNRTTQWQTNSLPVKSRTGLLAD